MNKFKEEAVMLLKKAEANKKYEAEHPGWQWGRGFDAHEREPHPHDRHKIAHDIQILLYAFDPGCPLKKKHRRRSG